MKKYDAIVIGSGQAGTPLSKKLAESGLKTALIEQRWVGGTCVNDGCSPTKAMIASARVAYLARKSKEMGITTGKIAVDIATILSRKNEIVQRMRGNSEKGIKKTNGLDLIFGSASFSNQNEITVKLNAGGQIILSADQFFINTGAKPFIPKIQGLEDIDYLTSTTILDLEEIPEHLLIIGSGYVGLEFAQMYKRFGSEVTVLSRSERLMSREDTDISEEIEKILTEEDILLLKKSTLQSFEKSGRKITASYLKNGKTATLTCSHVLIAAGRVPQTENLNLNVTAVKRDEKGYIEVNEFLETSAKGIFALGDVNGGPPFTHIAFDDYRIAIHNITKTSKISTKDRILPYCMFTDPQLGRVGLTEREARAKGLDIIVATMPNSAAARAIENGDTRGMMKAVVDAKSGKILGASILGTEGGEVVSVLQMAMLGGIKWQQIHDCIFAHPTYSESLNNLFMFPDK